MNDFFSYSEIGERYRDNALPWDQIPTTRFAPVGTLNISSLQKNSQDRMSKNSYVNLESLEKICLALDCRIEDVIEIHRNEVE